MIEFSVTNFKSIDEKQTFSFVANADKTLPENCFSPSALKNIRLLHSAAMYGANAAGKSNLIKAMYFMRNFVLESSQKMQEGDEIRIEPFLFHHQPKHQSSEFEMLFVIDDVRYQYGFSVDNKRVKAEWLNAYPVGKQQQWFVRHYDEEDKKYKWVYGTKFKGEHKVWQQATRENALFLSTAVQLNSEQLKPLFNWFKNKFHVFLKTPEFPSLNDLELFIKDPAQKTKFLNFLNAADDGIIDILIKKTEYDLSKLPDPLQETIKKSRYKPQSFKIEFAHKAVGAQKEIVLEREAESVGTQKLLAITVPWLTLLKDGGVLVVDELNNSLHPLLVRFLIQMVNNPVKNKKSAQLFFSTHDISVLDNDLFRRDQIWFVEKDDKNASRVYPLTDFSPRKSEALAKGYLQGRYGALPFIGDWKF